MTSTDPLAQLPSVDLHGLKPVAALKRLMQAVRQGELGDLTRPELVTLPDASANNRVIPLEVAA